jgi:small subunit ribosomal protein S15
LKAASTSPASFIGRADTFSLLSVPEFGSFRGLRREEGGGQRCFLRRSGRPSGCFETVFPALAGKTADPSGFVRGSLNEQRKHPTSMAQKAQLDKGSVIGDFRTHESDTGSPDVQIALLSQRISHLTEHLRTHRKDFHSRRGLIAMTNRRRKLLDYVKKHDLDKYKELISRLGLRH